jgi:hypothetical protein
MPSVKVLPFSEDTHSPLSPPGAHRACDVGGSLFWHPHSISTHAVAVKTAVARTGGC